ncbi:MAG: hypothetical protein K0R21_1151 [Anaerocolumna sp.]|jgi:hypothetical protein|nr:hypothetical protein [Anaerocolumna sp.]
MANSQRARDRARQKKKRSGKGEKENPNKDDEKLNNEIDFSEKLPINFDYPYQDNNEFWGNENYIPKWEQE